MRQTDSQYCTNRPVRPLRHLTAQPGLNLGDMLLTIALFAILVALITPFLLSHTAPDQALSVSRQAELQKVIHSESISRGLLPLDMGPGRIFQDKLNATRVFRADPSDHCVDESGDYDIGTQAFELSDGTVIVTDPTWDNSLDYDDSTPSQDAGRLACVFPKGENHPEKSYLVRFIRESNSIADLNAAEGGQLTVDEVDGSESVDTADQTIDNGGNGGTTPPPPPPAMRRCVAFTRQAWVASESYANLELFLRSTETHVLNQIKTLFKKITGQNLDDEFDIATDTPWEPGVIKTRIEQLTGKTFEAAYGGRRPLNVNGVIYYYNSGDMLYKIGIIRESRRIRQTLGQFGSALAGLNLQPSYKKFTLVDDSGGVLASRISWSTFKSRIKINGMSPDAFLNSYQEKFNAYAYSLANDDWNLFMAAMREDPSIEVIYTHSNGQKYMQEGISGRYSPIKVSLDETHAQLNSDHSFWVDMDGLTKDNLPAIKTTGGLNMNEAWLVYDRHNNGLFSQDGKVDGDDIFGDHMGRYKSGYEDLFSAFKSSIEVDETGQKYIPLKELNWFESSWIGAGRFFGWDKTPNPSYDLQLLTFGKQTLPASSLVKRIYTDYKNVKEEDKTGENAILQRGKLTYKNGKSADSADMWFSAADFQDD